jgi:hypothetical protein
MADTVPPLIEDGARAICRTRCEPAHPCDMVLDGAHCRPEKCRNWHLYTDDATACARIYLPRSAWETPNPAP